MVQRTINIFGGVPSLFGWNLFRRLALVPNVPMFGWLHLLQREDTIFLVHGCSSRHGTAWRYSSFSLYLLLFLHNNSQFFSCCCYYYYCEELLFLSAAHGQLADLNELCVARCRVRPEHIYACVRRNEMHGPSVRGRGGKRCSAACCAVSVSFFVMDRVILPSIYLHEKAHCQEKRERS